jgi:hypothetical protein
MPTRRVNYIDTPFPVDALPQAVADICREISHSFEVPLELPCTTALGLLAACCQKKAIVRINSTYTEQLNLYKETTPQRFVGTLKGILPVHKHTGGNVANGIVFRN